MYVLKIKGKDLYLDRKSYELTDLEHTRTYKTASAAKCAINSSGYVLKELKINVTDLEIRKVELRLV